MLKEVGGVQEILHSQLIYACNESDKLCVWRPEDIGCNSIIKEYDLTHLIKWLQMGNFCSRK